METKKSKDWVGNSVALFSCNGASNHSLEERASRDFYSSDPVCAVWLLKLEPQINNIWEPAVGNGALAEPLREAGKLKAVSDIVDRGYYPEGISTKYNLDFLTFNKKWKGDIVTNPPYNVCLDWAQHQLDLIQDGRYSALFMKITFLEGKSRKSFLEENPPIRVWVSSSRIMCYKNGNIEDGKKNSSATCYAWYVWQKGYKGDTIIKWFN